MELNERITSIDNFIITPSIDFPDTFGGTNYLTLIKKNYLSHYY